MPDDGQHQSNNFYAQTLAPSGAAAAAANNFTSKEYQNFLHQQFASHYHESNNNTPISESAVQIEEIKTPGIKNSNGYP